MNLSAGRCLIAARVCSLAAVLCTFGTPRVSAETAVVWPKDASAQSIAPVEKIQTFAGGEQFLYRSSHHEFVSDVRLSKSVVAELSELFEATYASIRALPLGHTLRVPGQPRQTHFRTRLFLTDASYRAAGGPPSSVGVFVGHSGEVLVPLSSLGVKSTGRRVVLDPKRGDTANKTLIHELVHQLTAKDQGGTHLWYREGLAEYLSSCHYKDGQFSFENRDEALAAFFGNTSTVTCIRMDEFLPIPRLLFRESLGRLGPQNKRHYETALLLVDFLFHRDTPNGAAPAAGIRKYLKAVHSGTDADEALHHLLAGRTYGEFQRDFTAAYRRAGLELKFEPLDRPVRRGTNPNLNPR